MSGFTFITLKLYHGGALLYEGEEARYVGGLVSEYVGVDVDVDTISYFEIKDYIKELGYNPNCKFSIRPPNSCILGDIGNDDILLAMCNCLQNWAVLEVYVHMPEEESGATFNKVGTTENRASETIEYNEVGEAAFNGVDVSLNTTSNIPSTSNPTALNTDPSDSEDSEYSVKGSDESTEESDDSKGSELLEDNQYGSDVHEELIQLRAEKRFFLRRRKRRERISADTEEVPCGNAGADLGFDETAINTNTLEGRLGGDEPYYASSGACSFETDTNDSCLEEDKVIEQPNIRVFKLQELIRKKYNVHVGKTTTRRARAKILNEIMGDHVKEFGRILDYKDELLRSNPGSTCVVKIGEANESGREVFEAFYIYFVALKMAFMSARKCIGLDGCFLKGGLDIAIKELLPACEERRCARHILANWSKN
ncbi:hypothetical protein KY290_017212 [Solanum tuberosum]|uniref:PB1-like domain-containing protein n=1 Tax=Solanum tuberosum TaxID=4113 RepID=A0ABQ7VC89_SOLTU|nr:hypothetical protein KY284_016245 [Solanum tuberosum]KAH0701976.1 hypothetical protein KY285_016254 [Solanum tuberosum]KAH0761139.1 hypothetical protein KY290_017212 [Solanum tuberosum]